MVTDLLNKKSSLCVVGLGYVGLPVALALAKKIKVVGFDLNIKRVEALKMAIDPNGETTADSFDHTDIIFTSSIQEIAESRFFVVCVPTPVDEHQVPNLSTLFAACKTIGEVLKKGDYVVFESTVYPGCTEEDCIPILEAESGLKAGVAFKYGYSPERINPGDRAHTIATVIKVVAGCDEEALETISNVYELICTAGVYKAANIKVAEAAKVIENTQRDLNIALMNELSIIFDQMNISTQEVLDAAKTKWNFLPFTPGLVGGHCIGVDPYYLTYKAASIGYQSKVITAGRQINDTMPGYITDKILKHLIAQVGDVRESRVLVMGATFKENVSDIRNSKAVNIIAQLKNYFIQTDVIDPLASADEMEKEYDLLLSEKPQGMYDAIIIAVAHQSYIDIDQSFFENITHPNALIADIKGIYGNKISSRKYWSL